MDTQKGTNQNRDAFEALAPYFGKPRRRDFDADNFFHPAFGYAHYFEREDAGYHEGGTPGYTGSTYRGAHISIPGFDEMGGLQVIDLSFHKGTTYVDTVSFDGGPGYSAALELLGFGRDFN